MADHCPHGYADPQAWCDWRNTEIAGSGHMWRVGPGGVPFITDDPVVSARWAAEDRARKEEDRRRFNWRQMHPVTEADHAA